MIIAKTLQENDVASNCPYRPLAQFACSHDRCHECEVDHFNVAGLLKMQAVGILGLKLVQLLDIERRNDILR